MSFITMEYMNMQKCISRIATLTTLGLSLFATNAIAGEQVQKSQEANNIKYVTIENLRGKIEVIGWDNAQIDIAGELDDKAKELVFRRSGNSFKIKVVVPQHHQGGWNEQGSDLKIRVPQGVRVDFQGVSSDFVISETFGGAEVSTVSGSIKASDLKDTIQLSSISGDINSRDTSGKISLSSVSGDIDDRNSQGRLKVKVISGSLSSQSQATEVSINSVSGDAELSLAAVDEINMSTVSGDVDVKLSLNDNGLAKVSSVSGDYDIALQERVNATFRFSSSAGGDFVNQITRDKPNKAKYGPSSSLNFEAGNGSASVRGSTVSGRIKLKTQ